MQAIIAIADNKEIFDNLFTYSILCGLRFKITCSSEEALNFFYGKPYATLYCRMQRYKYRAAEVYKAPCACLCSFRRQQISR